MAKRLQWRKVIWENNEWSLINGSGHVFRGRYNGSMLRALREGQLATVIYPNDFTADSLSSVKKIESWKRCVLCDHNFVGCGNNAEPLKKGQCCDQCNIKVIRARLKQ